MNWVSRSNENLVELFTRLIAEHDHIRHEEVTLEYIENRRRSDIYPTTHYNIHSSFGGYDTTGLATLTRNEIDTIVEKINELIQSQ